MITKVFLKINYLNIETGVEFFLIIKKMQIIIYTLITTSLINVINTDT